MRTLTEKYREVNEGRYAKAQFLRDARLAHPDMINQYNSFDDAVTILKNRGLLFEIKEETNEELSKYKADKTPEYNIEIESIDRYPIEAVERGIDYELEEMGLDSVEVPSEDVYYKALDKSLKNLEKDFNYYLHKVANTEPVKKRTDLNREATPANIVDKDNGLQVVKEEKVIKEALKRIIRNILSEDTSNKRQFLKEVDQNISKERNFKIKNTLNTVLPLLDDVVDAETIDPGFIDDFVKYLEDELKDRAESGEPLLEPDITERRKFTYEGKIL